MAMATAAALAVAVASLSSHANPAFIGTTKPKLVISSSNLSKLVSTSTTSSRFPCLVSQPQSLSTPLASAFTTRAGAYPFSSTSATFHGVCYVVGDNIDTDQIIPAEYLTLVPSDPDEYEKLGSYALIGLPSYYEKRFVEPGEKRSKYSVVIAGPNFGCGPPREHAPVALGAAGVEAVLAESYGEEFFRDSLATGQICPLASEGRIREECRTGDVVTIELRKSRLINHTTGKKYELKPMGDAGPVIDHGSIQISFEIRFLVNLGYESFGRR